MSELVQGERRERGLRDQETQNRRVEAATLGTAWVEMEINQKAAFLEDVARRLSRMGDILGAETARAWAAGILEKELGQRPAVNPKEPMRELPPREMIARLWEVIDWAGDAWRGQCLSARVLRDSCHYLIDVTRQQEREEQREGRKR